MIKKILLGLGFTVISFVGFTNSDWVVRQNGVYGNSTIDDSIQMNVANKGQLMSQRFGNTQRMLAFSSFSGSRIYFFWSYNQKPYYFINYAGHKLQGYLKNYQLCDEITGQDSISNCTYQDITDNFATEIGGLFQSMTINDYWAYDIHVGNCYGSKQLKNKVCFSSSEYHKSICFSAGAGNTSVCVCDDCGNLQGSLGFDYDLDFTRINGAYLNTPPGFTPIGDIEGSSSVATDSSLTGNLVYNQCTNGYIKSIFSSFQSNGDIVCYAGTYNSGLIDNNFNGETYMYDYGFTIKQLLNLDNGYGGLNTLSAEGYYQWYMSSMDDMKRYKLGRIGVNPFLGRPVAVYTYFETLYDNGMYDFNRFFGDPIFNINYCSLSFLDPDALYTGLYFQDECSVFSPRNGKVLTGRSGRPDVSEILPPGFDISSSSSSGVVISVDWSGTLSGSNSQNFDGKTFINDFYQKLQSVFKNPTNSVTGIIPGYILIFLFAIILFRFLAH